MFRPFKTNSSAQKMYTAIRNDEIVPPRGIRPGREKAHNAIRLPFVYFPHRLGDPPTYLPTIWRIHPTDT